MVLISLVLAATTAAAAAEPVSASCAVLALEAGVHCAQAPTGVVVSDDPAIAAEYAAVMTAGEARFRRHFSHPPLPYAVVVGPGVNPISTDGVSGGRSALQQTLSEAGFSRVLPWPTAQQMDDLRAESVRGALRTHLAATGLEGEALEAAVAEQLRNQPASTAAPGTRESGAAHELGHMWAIDTYWPDREHPTGAAREYGGPAADWLDESAAVLMEDERLTASRLEAFQREWSKAEGARPKPLAAFFVDEHPLAAEGVAAAREVSRTVARAAAGSDPAAGRTSVARVRTGSAGMGAALFYAQARLVADFLIERSGDPAVSDSIARAYADGRTMEQWLAAEGPPRNLPATVAELDSQWAAWLAARYGPAG